MKIWNVISGVASTLFVASILTFGLSTEIASAHGPACEKHHKKDDGCSPPGGGGGNTETVFDVAMVRGSCLPDFDPMGNPLEGVVISNGACGSTEGELQLGAVFPVFPDTCAVIGVCFMSDPTGHCLPLRVYYVQVNLNKSNVKIWFRADNENNLFVTDHLAVTISGDGPPSAFTVEVNEFNLTAERNHNPGKGDLVGPIAIGEIVYTPVE